MERKDARNVTSSFCLVKFTPNSLPSFSPLEVDLQPLLKSIPSRKGSAIQFIHSKINRVFPIQILG